MSWAGYLPTIGSTVRSSIPIIFRGTHSAAGDSLLQSIDPARSFRILLKERAADIIVAAGEGGALLPLLLRRPFRFKAPITLWDIRLGSRWRLRQRILQAVVPRADAIFVLSTSQKHHVETRWAPRGEVVVVGHMVDTDFFHPIETPLLRARPVDRRRYRPGLCNVAARHEETRLRPGHPIQQFVARLG